MNAAPEIKGWCPGALRPMASGDGLLIRAKTIGSVLPAATARGVAEIASTCGNGLIDLSQRAQLQLRGLSEATVGEALRRLAALSLLARDSATESVLNIVASPLAGLAHSAAFDANDIARKLAREIEDDPNLLALPGKFLFLVDDASPLGLADMAADIRLEAQDDGDARMAVIVDGARDHAFMVAPDAAIDTAIGLARTFLALRQGREFELRRMRALIGALGLPALARAAGLEAEPRPPRRPAAPPDIFGAKEIAGTFFATVAAPFGRWRADELSALADSAARDGTGELRLTPWRAILAPAPTRDAAREIATAAAARGLIVEASDPRLAVVACPGAPACPQALGETRAPLERLAPLARGLAREGLARESVALHVSGCAKGCARPAPTRVTLLARGETFDLIDDGRAQDAPGRTGLTLSEVERELAARAAGATEEAPCPVH